ncbi:methyltransferase [Ruegeria hyattellae]|uniref:methyltransferase n=1 Tax=Ruegeria hyattellae TaxID=3233337 RepID=UPI00355ADE4E
MADRVQRSFSRSFGTYHESAVQQAQVVDRLVQELCDNGAPQHFTSALELGAGTGHLTQRLCAEFSFGTLTVNDLSPETQLVADAARAMFLRGDAKQIEWPKQPDLIASASMIQWLPAPAAFLRRAAAALAAGGWLAVSGFGPEQYRELAQIGSSAKAPGLFRPDDLIAAVQGDLEIVATGETVQQIHFASPQMVLRHLRNTGVNGRAQKVWTKSCLLQFSREYTRRFDGEAGVPLTYHPIWIIARKRS